MNRAAAPARPPGGASANASVSASANALEQPYHRLAALPRTLWGAALVSHTGPVAPAGLAERIKNPARPWRHPAEPAAPDSTGQRLHDLQRWREALARGELPPPDADFGDAEASAALRAAAGALGLAGLCAGTGPGADAISEQLLQTLLWHLDQLIDLQPRLGRAQAIAEVAQGFSAVWTVTKGDWQAVQVLLHGLGDLAHLRWGDLRGQLRRREWQEAQRLGQLLLALPELAALIRQLGRSQRCPTPQVPPPAPAPLRANLATAHRAAVKPVETLLPDMPGELRGIRHSGRIEAMLGSEAAMLLHPVLHKLWRARRAEGRLLTYDSQAVLIDLRPDPTATPRRAVLPPAPEALVRGPIIVCIDTSGSMRGAPEAIAKAVVLQAVRTAFAEQRGCLLVAFGGLGEVVERELVHSADGLAALLDLIGQGFDGGTDLQSPIERAIERVQTERWASADLLIVSDGEFGCTAATLAQLDAVRERQGLRVQGVLVGDRETMGLMEVADSIFWVRDWRRHGPGAQRAGGFSPVHSKSLTALYFPNALSGRAARHRPP